MAHNADRLWDTARAFMPSRILLTAIELKLFAALGEGPRTSAEVAAALETDPRATDRLMNALAALGFLNKEGERFSNTPDTDALLVPGRPTYAGEAIAYAATLWRRWSTLTDAVKAGTSVVGEQAGEREDWVSSFISAMHYNASASAPSVVPLIDLTGVERLLDVGGGSGAYSIAFCRAKPDLHAVVFDLPDVVPLTQKYVAEAGLSDRVSTSSGDFSRDELGRDFDLAFISQILHMNSPEENIELFRKCFRALRPGGTIVIQEFVIDEGRTSPVQAAVFALNMLVATRAGDTYTESEIGGWLAEAGFEGMTRADAPSAAIITATKPC